MPVKNADALLAAEVLTFVREKLNLKLKLSNASELNRMASLLYEFKHLFNDESGEFPHGVRIPTRGDPIARNQHIIPLKHQGLVDAEIQDMITRGVVEECPDGRGWRTPLLTVTKVDGSICVCCNFERTLNLRLCDEEVYSQKPADELFASICPG